MPNLFRNVLLLALLRLLLCAPVPAQNAALGEGEAQKCEERIASVRRDVLIRYDDALGELQLAFQKSGDLEGALAVRSERQRVKTEQVLTEKEFVTEPKALRTLQAQTLAKANELVAALVQETVPKLIELKRQLTVAGRLDEAVSVRSAVERLQNAHLPIARPDAGTVVTADTLLQTYAADRSRADKMYRGQKITVRGVVGGFRQDPADNKSFHVYLAGSGNGWVQCAFPVSEYRFREEQQFNNATLVISPKGNEAAAVRLQKGATAEIQGTCDGFEELVRLSKCEPAR